LVFLGDALRRGAFAALVTGVFLRFDLVLPLAFFFVAITASQIELLSLDLARQSKPNNVMPVAYSVWFCPARTVLNHLINQFDKCAALISIETNQHIGFARNEAAENSLIDFFASN